MRRQARNNNTSEIVRPALDKQASESGGARFCVVRSVRREYWSGQTTITAAPILSVSTTAAYPYGLDSVELTAYAGQNPILRIGSRVVLVRCEPLKWAPEVRYIAVPTMPCKLFTGSQQYGYTGTGWIERPIVSNQGNGCWFTSNSWYDVLCYPEPINDLCPSEIPPE